MAFFYASNVQSSESESLILQFLGFTSPRKLNIESDFEGAGGQEVLPRITVTWTCISIPFRPKVDMNQFLHAHAVLRVLLGMVFIFISQACATPISGLQDLASQAESWACPANISRWGSMWWAMVAWTSVPCVRRPGWGETSIAVTAFSCILAGTVEIVK